MVFDVSDAFGQFVVGGVKTANNHVVIFAVVANKFVEFFVEFGELCIYFDELGIDFIEFCIDLVKFRLEGFFDVGEVLLGGVIY